MECPEDPSFGFFDRDHRNDGDVYRDCSSSLTNFFTAILYTGIISIAVNEHYVWCSLPKDIVKTAGNRLITCWVGSWNNSGVGIAHTSMSVA